MRSSNLPCKIVRGTIRVISKVVPVPDGGKEERLCVTFSTKRGKGNGAQVVLVEEFADFVHALRDASNDGFETAETVKAYRPASEVAMDTLSLSGPTDDDGNPTGDADTVNFRVRGGKGAKPARIPLADVDSVISYLEGRIPKLEQVLEQVNAARENEADEAGEE